MRYHVNLLPLTPTKDNINTSEYVTLGIASAPALFQKIMDTILHAIPYTVSYLDNILVMDKMMKNI